MDYEDDIRIDESALDVEWLEQPRLMYKYTRHAAERKQAMDLAKEHLEFVSAEIAKQIRDVPDEFDLEGVRLTDAIVNSTVKTDDRYKKAVRRYNQQRFEYDVAQGVVRAFDQRKSALENLVKLHGQQYFAGPSVPRDLSKEWVKSEKKHNLNKQISKTINSKTKKDE